MLHYFTDITFSTGPRRIHINRVIPPQNSQCCELQGKPDLYLSNYFIVHTLSHNYHQVSEHLSEIEFIWFCIQAYEILKLTEIITTERQEYKEKITSPIIWWCFNLPLSIVSVSVIILNSTKSFKIFRDIVLIGGMIKTQN